MTYKNRIQKLAGYFRRGEKDRTLFKIGLEMEHLVVDRNTLESVPYQGTGGIEPILEELIARGWSVQSSGDHILNMKKNLASISLEPGGQLEVDIVPLKCIGSIERAYLDFLNDIVPLLDKRGKALIATGYHPQSSIKNLCLLPKERYRYMYDYFSNTQPLAHNMMKGTASTQVSLDYSSEEDYIKKFRVISFLCPVVYFMFDNTPFFEGSVCRGGSIRRHIWDNCDNDRCGNVKGAFEGGFGYEKYARCILDSPPIIVPEGDDLRFTGKTALADIQGLSFTDGEINHILSMYFFNVRTRTYLEIRMGDSLPYPYNLAYCAFWKGLLYSLKNLNTLFEKAVCFNSEEMEYISQDILSRGWHAQIGESCLSDFVTELLCMARNGLPCCEKNFLSIVQCMFERRQRPRDVTLQKLNEGKLKALKWCITDARDYTGRCDGIACC